MQALSEPSQTRHRYHRTSAGMRYLGLLVLLALIATLSARLTGYRPASVAPSPVVESRSLLFTDLARGFIDVHDADDKALLLRIGPGEEAFLRAVVRGLARQRRAIDERRDIPFKLDLLADGRLVISDRISGEIIQLDAFGEPNTRVFLALLRGAASSPTAMSPP